MKKNFFKVMLISILLLTFASCEKGSTTQQLTGYETSLPEELKGLKVYNVSIGALSDINIEVLDNKVVGTSYSEGKYTRYVAIINKNTPEERVIVVIEIIYENDSVIVIKK